VADALKLNQLRGCTSSSDMRPPGSGRVEDPHLGDASTVLSASQMPHDGWRRTDGDCSQALALTGWHLKPVAHKTPCAQIASSGNERSLRRLSTMLAVRCCNRHRARLAERFQR